MDRRRAQQIVIFLLGIIVVISIATWALSAPFLPGVPFSGGPIPEGPATPGAALPGVPNGGVNYVPPVGCNGTIDLSTGCVQPMLGVL